MSSLPAFLAITVTLATIASAYAQPTPGGAIPVGVDNFVRAETDLYMKKLVADGALGRFVHNRQPIAIDAQNVIRMNRDTLYSDAVFDLDAGPVTITMPAAGKRFMSMQIIDENHYVPAVYYGAGIHTLSKGKIGTRYVAVFIRTLVDPADPKDIQQVRTLQDKIEVRQSKVGEFVVPKWEQESQKKVRDALLVLGSTNSTYTKAFGTKDAVDPVQHLIGTAGGWGGNPSKDATYLSRVVPENDGKTIYRLKVRQVPVKAFWSVSVYNADGYFEKNPLDAYSLNNITAKTDADGVINIQFGGCDGKIPNCLPTVPGWNYTVRLYQPGGEILDGRWKFPQPQRVPQ